jgi:hypothetical protein
MHLIFHIKQLIILKNSGGFKRAQAPVAVLLYLQGLIKNPKYCVYKINMSNFAPPPKKKKNSRSVTDENII